MARSGFAELLAGRGLGQAERLRSPRDTASFDDVEEGLQLSEAWAAHA
ncbi:hypothetical protein [Roseomonas chloroacetimidivorans]|jgi:hypothetical protein